MGRNYGIRNDQIRFIREIVSITAELAHLDPTDLVQVVLEAGNGQAVYASLPYHPVSFYNRLENCNQFWEMIDDLDESDGYYFEDDPLVIDDHSFFHVKVIRRIVRE